MSKDFEYDPETGSFRFDESGGKTKKKNDVDVGGWILIAALFAFGLWPIGLIALISKLSDKPKKVNSSRGGMRTSTSPRCSLHPRLPQRCLSPDPSSARWTQQARSASSYVPRRECLHAGCRGQDWKRNCLPL